MICRGGGWGLGSGFVFSCFSLLFVELSWTGIRKFGSRVGGGWEGKGIYVWG